MSHVELCRYIGKSTGQIVLEFVRERIRTRELEESTTPFYVFRTDTQHVLAKGVIGYDAAKQKANDLRKRYGLKWDQVSFKSEKNRRGGSTTSLGTDRRYSRIEYAPRINPSKGRRFRGRYDADGNFADID